MVYLVLFRIVTVVVVLESASSPAGSVVTDNDDDDDDTETTFSDGCEHSRETIHEECILCSSIPPV